jgi:hypothetical protein
MFRTIRLLTVVFSIAGTLAWMVQGCGGDDTSSASVPDMGTLAKDVLPTVKGAASSAKLSPLTRARAFSGYSATEEHDLQGSVAFNVYRTFADPTLDPLYPDDSWGVENVRNNLDIAQTLYDLMSQSSTTGKTIQTSVHGTDFSVTIAPQQPAASSLASPYPFLNIPAGISYTTALPVEVTSSSVDGGMTMYSVWAPGDTFYMLSTQVMGAPKNENTVYEGQYQSSTASLRLNRASRVIEADGNFITHMELSGNTSTLEFSLKMAKRSGGVGGYHLSIAGKGVSGGSGHFYVMEVASCSSADCLAAAASSWYCISSTASYADWKSFINDGVTYVDSPGVITHGSDHAGFTGDCATYATALDDPAMALLTDAELPDEAGPYASTLGM